VTESQWRKGKYVKRSHENVFLTHAKHRNGWVDYSQILHIDSHWVPSDIFEATPKSVGGLGRLWVRMLGFPVDFDIGFWHRVVRSRCFTAKVDQSKAWSRSGTIIARRLVGEKDAWGSPISTVRCTASLYNLGIHHRRVQWLWWIGRNKYYRDGKLHGVRQAPNLCISSAVCNRAPNNWRACRPTFFHALEAIQRWSAICRVWPWTLTYQKFLLCISRQDHTKN